MYILKKRMLLLILFASGIHTSLLGQLPGAVMTEIGKSMPKPVPGSPNASALGRFGSYNVSPYTGLPSISVPIFEIKSGTLSLPITLDYHASGIRMLDNAGWVGLGWSLSTGGQVTRDMRGSADEQTYWHHPLIEFPTLCGPSAKWAYIRDAENGVYDTQPDIFSYSIGPKSGNFILGHAGESPFLFPYDPIKVYHNGINSTGSFELDNFRITDVDGTMYQFGETASGHLAKETTTVDRSPFLTTSITTSWLLTSIKAPNADDAILFNYQRLGYALTMEPRTTVTVLDNCVGTDCPNHGPDPVQTGTNMSTITQLGVNEIVFSGGKAKFIAATKRLDQLNLNQLDRIEIYSETAGVYSLTKTIKFHYSYFGYLTAPQSPVNLKLEKVEFIGSDGEVDNTYSFEYHTNGFSWNQGTPYSKDFWGFYNGKPNNDLIPQQAVQYTENNSIIQRTVTIGSADRNTVSTYMKEGVLKRINFPTGGYSEFDYEPHRYLENNVPTIAGGLRILSVKSYDGTSAAPITKTYAYGQNESGLGMKNFYTDLLNFRSESYVHQFCCLVTSCAGTATYRQRTFFGNSMTETSASEGAAVVYPVVTEYYGDVTSNIGKIIYEYDNGNFLPDSLQVIIGSRSSKNFKSSYAWRRGKLTRKTVKTKSGQLISESLFAYTLFKKIKKHIGTAAERMRTYPLENVCIGDCNNEFGEPISLNEFRWTPYYQISGAMRQTSATEKTYEDGASGRAISTSRAMSYDPNYLEPTRETQSGVTDTEEVVTYSKYPFSYSFIGTQSGTARAIQMLLEKNNLNTQIEQYTTRRNTDGSNERVLGGKLNVYRTDPNNTNHVVADSILFIESVAPVPLSGFSPSSITNASRLARSPFYKNAIKFLSFDGKGNVTELKKENDYITTYLWAYRNELPVAEVINSDLDVLPDTYTDFTFEGGSAFSGNIATPTAITPTITIGHAQLVQLSVSFSHSGATPTSTPVLDIILKKSDGSVAYDPTALNNGIYQSSFVLPAGTYTFYYTGNAYSTAPYAIVNARFSVTLNYQSKTARNPKLYHSSFEETGVTLASAKTGSKVNAGSVSIPLPSASGKYWVTWWQKSATGNWSEQKVLLTVPYIVGGVTQTTYTAGSGSTYVDEVRLYPEKAFMTTYTYDPVLGITSVTDRNNKTTYYSYDTMGRLQLVRDPDGKIVSNKVYHYKK
jgi:YD repeat-containing protein